MNMKVKNVIKGYCSRNDITDLTIISEKAIEYSGDVKNYLYPCDIMEDYKKELDNKEVTRVENTCNNKLFIFI